MQARLVTLCDGKVVDVYPVDEAGTIYGRAGGDLVQIMDPEISKRHMKIFLKGQEWRLLDLGSKNGTSVNGTPVQGCFLQSGDVIRIGGTTLYFIAEENLPVKGQAIDVSRNAYQPTMQAKLPDRA